MAGVLEGRVALVTGGGSGLGRASALVFVREGAKVVIADVQTKGGYETVRMIKEINGEAIFIEADVTKAAEVEAAVQAAIATFGGLDCSLNGAGVEGPIATTTELTEEGWDQVLDVNLKGVWLCMKHEIPAMLQRGRGAIVNISSAVGLVGAKSVPAYVASKHGVVGLTKAAALEFAQQGIRINAVCPGNIHTPMAERVASGFPEGDGRFIARHPIGRMGFPEELAEAVVWLCSDAASFVTGHAMSVDGGWVAQ